MAEINDNLRIASKADLNALTAEDVHARPDTWMPTASDVGAADAANHNISTYTDILQLGLTNNDFVADDFNANIHKLMISMHQSGEFKTRGTNQNLIMSIKKKLIADGCLSSVSDSSYLAIHLKKFGTGLSPAKVEISFDSSTLQKIWACRIDGLDNTVVSTPFIEVVNESGFVPLNGVGGVHNIKTYTSLAQFGVDDSTLNPEDVGANMYTVINSMGAESVLTMRAKASDSPLIKSIKDRINSDLGKNMTDSTTLVIRLTVFNITNAPAQLEVTIDSNNSNVSWVTRIDRTSLETTSTVFKFIESYNAAGFVAADGSVPMTNTIKVENKNGYSAIDKVRTVNGVDYMERLGVGSIDNIPAVSIELTAPSGNPSYARLDLFEDKVTFQSNNGTRKALFGEHNFPAPMPNAGFHNSVYRGKSLGSAVTAAQWAAIKAGTFDDLFIGDYWTIGGVTYRIAAFDYYYKTGDTSCETHHVTLVPDTSMYTHVMNDTNIIDGAYVGSKMYTTGLTQAKTTINNAFGSAHILKHRQYLQNATTNGVSTGGAWYDSTIELMTEQNVYGCKIFGDVVHGTTFPNNYTIDKSQYPLFAFRPDMISNHQWFWLRDVANAARFARVNGYGDAYSSDASNVSGVRPAFSIVS